MNEEFVQFVWKHRLFSVSNQISTTGDAIEIIDVGKQNFDSGPDFFDARIKVNGIQWAGNVEIHLKSSHWNQHNHHTNPAYNNVILHVVMEEDLGVQTSDGRMIPCLKLNFNLDYYKNYKSILASEKWIPCFDEVKKVEQFFVKNWIDRMLLERLQRKSEEIHEVLKQNAFSWEETLYQMIARYFGMKVNAEPFHQLARSIPLKFLAKQKNSHFQLEALLFGQSGLFSIVKNKDEYYRKLRSEYKFLQKKYQLAPLSPDRWKWLRLRPANFPTIRIAQFASLIFQSSSLFSKIKKSPDYIYIAGLLTCQASEYWTSHYQFGEKSAIKKKQLGRIGVDSIIINTIVPILFLYGESVGNQKFKDKACQLLEQMKPEQNAITNKWEQCGISVQSAYQSQALLHLKSNYCDQFRCLQCELGNRIIRTVSAQNKTCKTKRLI